MIRCGLLLSVDGVWEEKQLFSHLQEIIRKYSGELAGTAVKRITGDSPRRQDASPNTNISSEGEVEVV